MYFVQYMRKIMMLSEGKNLAIVSSDEILDDTPGFDNLAQLDIYLIRKLKESRVTLKIINKYAEKLSLIDRAHNYLVAKKVITPNMLSCSEEGPSKYQKLVGGQKAIFHV
jgi:DNA helicase HerA-like ATPase